MPRKYENARKREIVLKQQTSQSRRTRISYFAVEFTCFLARWSAHRQAPQLGIIEPPAKPKWCGGGPLRHLPFELGTDKD
jgi:hypothetical protein